MAINTDVTDIYKEFLRQLRAMELEEVYPLVTFDTSPKLRRYVRELLDIPFNEGEQYALYGEIKKLISSYICFHTDYVEAVIKQHHDYSEACTRHEFVRLIEDSIETQRQKQFEFEKEYLPTKTEYEKACYQKIDTMFVFYLEQYLRLEQGAQLLEEHNQRTFMKNYFDDMLKGETAKLQFTQQYLSFILVKRIREIDASMICNYHRLSKNFIYLKGVTPFDVGYMIMELYEFYKEWLLLMRSRHGRGKAQHKRDAQISRAIENVIQRLKMTNNKVVVNLAEEVYFWATKAVLLYDMMTDIGQLVEEKTSLEEQEQVLLAMGITEGSDNYNETLGRVHKGKNSVESKITRLGMSLFSVFDIKGDNETWFKDERGRRYFVDEYGHQVFSVGHKRRLMHLDCEGNYVEYRTPQKEFYDLFGRFVFDTRGNKTYQVAQCTSSYKLDRTTDRIHKITKDCGHSEIPKTECKMNVKHRVNLKVPEPPYKDYKGIVDKESVEYLSKSFSNILPQVLLDCATVQPKNPAYFMAHSLIRYKYREPHKLRQHRKKESENQTVEKPYDIEALFLHEVFS